MSEELNNYRPYTAAELSNLLHNERAERAEEVNALALAVGLERVHEAGSILAAVEKLAADRPAPAVQVPDGGVQMDDLLGAIGRGWCSPENDSKEMDSTLAIAIAQEVATLLNAATPRLACCAGGWGWVKLPATDHRITVDEEGVPTIMLGCGGFVISDVYAVSPDYAGVCFELRGEPKEVGTADLANYGKSSGQAGAVLKIVATRPESLRVLIGELQEAVDGFGTLPPAPSVDGEG